jgi:hypothetical protein
METNRTMTHAKPRLWNSASPIGRVYDARATDHVASEQVWHTQVSRDKQAKGMAPAKEACGCSCCMVPSGEPENWKRCAIQNLG